MEINKLCVFNKNERQLSTVGYGAENKNTQMTEEKLLAKNFTLLTALLG